MTTPIRSSSRFDPNWAHLGLLALTGALAWGAHQFSMSPFPTLVIGLVLTVGWLMLWERFAPYREAWRPSANDLQRDASFFGANAVADAAADLLLRAAALGAAMWWPVSGPVATLPLAAGVVLALVIAELGDYALHRLSHRGGWLWRVHVVHHRMEAVNTSNNFTTHPVNVLLRKLVRLLPLWLLGFSPEAILMALLFGQAQSFAAHANTRGRMGWLNYVIGTAELHRWHHSVRVEEALNFGSALPLWDQVFGTFHYPRDGAVRQVGVRGAYGVPAPAETWALLAHPFRG
ncbi:sterol desaturase family protein [Piscinibacter sp.]|uniref:sterol desaturase family protein n=1 Tax=Piscinibacter sp. TaxID=1903157 RepID=UPI002CC42EF4|nr:sterol desaturase family protein [Albitalea sp.]HUG26566.1 sterol desaturase family protein [Albitalea sp.]